MLIVNVSRHIYHHLIHYFVDIALQKGDIADMLKVSSRSFWLGTATVRTLADALFIASKYWQRIGNSNARPLAEDGG
jgi:hypothetical protein